MKLLPLAAKSAWSRKTGLILASLSIALSVMLLMGVDTIRKQAKTSFTNTISRTDLIVGARSGPVNLLLYSVFRIGDATANVSAKTWQEIAEMPEVAWTVPISLGDSHRGFRVMGTNQDYFRYYKYGDKRELAIESGKEFDDLYDTVLGREVADKLGYKVGDKIVLSHGLVATAFSAHDDKPFVVSGILERTGTPVDATVHVSLEAIEAIHVDWQAGTRSPIKINAEQARLKDLQPKSITAFMVGLENRIATFRLQRKINEFRKEALLAILPGATLATLWRTIGQFETILVTIASLVLLAGLLGMLTTLISTLNERRREMAILRAVGAHAWHIIALFALEALLIVLAGVVIGLILHFSLLGLAIPLLESQYGLRIALMLPDLQQWLIMGVALLLGLIFSLLPGLIAYRRSLQDGLQLKV